MRPVIFPPSFFNASVTFSSAVAPGLFTMPSYVPEISAGAVWAKALMLPSRNASVSNMVLCFTGLFLSGNLGRFVLLFTLERGLGVARYFSKRLRLMYGQICQDISIELDLSEF